MASHVSWNFEPNIDSHLLTLEASRLHNVLQGPTVFDLRKPSKRPIFVSTLLHGNETSGWNAVRRFLTEFRDTSIVVLIGNIAAAAKNMRHLPGETDFNRIWQQPLWRERIDQTLRECNPWCGVDIHNNSGPNPHYSVVTNLDLNTLSLAKIFSDKLIYTQHTQEILSHAVAEHCPSMTIETGTVDDPMSETRAYELLAKLNTLDEVPNRFSTNLEAYKTLAIVRVEHEDDTELETFPNFNRSLANKSFRTLKQGERFIDCLPDGWRLNVTTSGNQIETERFFDVRHRQAFLKRDVVLSMFTPNPRLAMQDCVCYFLTQFSLDVS